MGGRRMRIVASISVALVLLGLGQPAVGTGGLPEAQIVVGASAALTGPDQVLVSEMEGMGFDVTVVDDNAAVTATSATAVVLLSTSAQVAALGNRYKTLPAPLVALGNNAWPDTGLTQGPNGLNYDTENLVVLDSTHPVADGLPSTFAPAVTAGRLQSVNEPFLPSGADPVAARQGELARHVVYTVSAGGMLGDGSVAPARRLVLGFAAHTLTDLSADGYQLLANAVFWAAETATPVDIVVLEAPAVADEAPTGDLTLQLDNPAAADAIEAELEATFGPLETSTDAGTLHATVPAAATVEEVVPMADPGDPTTEEGEELDTERSYGHPIYCGHEYTFFSPHGRYTLRRRCGSHQGPWSWRMSPEMQAICVPYTVDERGMKWWKNGNEMPLQSPHWNLGCGYLFHGTYNPIAKGSRVRYEDIFEFRHHVGPGGDATIKIHGKLSFRGPT